MLAGGPAIMSTIETSETSTTAAEAKATALPIVTKPGRVPIKSWAGEFDPRTLEQATNVSNLPFAIDHVALMPDGHAGYGMPIGGVLFADKAVVPYAIGVLRAAAGALALKAFLTCGSPIGMKPIHQRLLKDGPTPFPTGLDLWINVWNEDDVATGVRGEELAALFEGGEVQGVETVGREPSFTNPFAAHNAPDYLSSLTMGLALHAAIESTAA